MLGWLNGLGEMPFARPTPDGYPLTELNWASSRQMSRRFEIARAIGAMYALGRGLQAFSQSQGGEWNNTVVVGLAEFGRTFRENGNRGTDHGHGTVYWVLGGAVHGGMVAGRSKTHLMTGGAGWDCP